MIRRIAARWLPLQSRDARLVLLLGVGQALSWGSSFYLPAILAVPMARDLGVPPAVVFAAFSLSLGLSALPGPAFGRAIDRHGGRRVLMATNLLFAVGLLALSAVRDSAQLFLAWALLGIAMGGGLYEAAFATVVRHRGAASRSAITGVTLIAGFASTLGWPLSAWMESRYGWRGACVGWCVLHGVIGLPLHALLPRVPAPAPAPSFEGPVIAKAGPPPAMTLALLAFVFAATQFVATAMAAHLPSMLQAMGASVATAVAVGALVGPAQVGARLLEFGFMRTVPPVLSARLAALGHPLGVAALLLFGVPAGAAFAVLHGAGNGVLTISRGMLPLVLFGTQGYGERQGWLMLPSRVAQALAPLLFGLALAWSLPFALWLSAGIGLSVVAALMCVPAQHNIPRDAEP